MANEEVEFYGRGKRSQFIRVETVRGKTHVSFDTNKLPPEAALAYRTWAENINNKRDRKPHIRERQRLSVRTFEEIMGFHPRVFRKAMARMEKRYSTPK